MVVKYTEEQLLEYKASPALPQGADLTPFVKMVEEVKVALNALFEHDEFTSTGRRRSSVTGSHRPNFRKHKVKEAPPQPDADGWITTTTKVKKSSFGTEQELERDSFREVVVKARPNNKNIGSSKPADPREIADKSNKAFNAFSALVSDDEEDDE